MSLYKFSTLKKIEILVLLLLISISAIAQQTDSLRTHHFLSLVSGVNQIKDENLHSKVITGTVTQLSYGFEKSKIVLSQFYFTIGYSRMKTKMEDLSKSVNLKLNLSYNRIYHLVQKKKVNYWLGPELSLGYSACYFPNWDDSHLYWADNFSFGAKNIFSVQLKNKNQWVSSVSLPFFSVFSRPELYRQYKIDDISVGGFARSLNSNISAAHLINVFFLKVQTEYRFPVFKNKREAFTYSFDYLRMKGNDGNAFKQLTHQIGIRLYL